MTDSTPAQASSSRCIALVAIYDEENNALRQLAPRLRAQGLRVLEIYFEDWRNNTFVPPPPQDVELLIGLLRDHRVAMVGFSLRASAYQELCRTLAERVRRELGLPVVVGGWHATVRPEVCLEFADAVCHGEADRSLPIFAERFFGDGDWRQTPGFVFRDAQGQLHRTPLLPLVEDLDSVPLRDYRHPDKAVIRNGRLRWGDPMARTPLFQVFASLGCVQRCAFCHNSFKDEARRSGPRLRVRSVDSVMGEIQAARRHNPHIRRVRFDDEIFGLDIRWLEQLAERYPDECGLPLDILSEPSIVTPRYAELLKRLGVKVVHLGIQSSEEVNRSTLQRRSTRDQTRRAVELLRGAGIYIRYLVMVDIPGVTDGQMDDLYQFMRSLPRPYDIYLFSLTWFPGTALVEQMLASGELHPSEVEGVATKTFRQYRVDLAYPRPSEQLFWLCLLVLLSSPMPLPLVDAAYRSRRWRSDPRALRTIATTANAAKSSMVVARMLREGELTHTLVRRWLDTRSIITM